MHCKYCGEEIKDESNFCFKCGRRIKEPIPEKTGKSVNSKEFFWLLAIIGVLLLILYSVSSETRSLSRQVPFQDPEYGTVYSGEIGEYHITGDEKYSIQKATDWTKTYSGEGTWGSEYTFHICWGTSCTDYYKIQFWNLQPETALIGYNTKYRTEYYQETKSRLDWWLGR